MVPLPRVGKPTQNGYTCGKQRGCTGEYIPTDHHYPTQNRKCHLVSNLILPSIPSPLQSLPSIWSPRRQHKKSTRSLIQKQVRLLSIDTSWREPPKILGQRCSPTNSPWCRLEPTPLVSYQKQKYRNTKYPHMVGWYATSNQTKSNVTALVSQ